MTQWSMFDLFDHYDAKKNGIPNINAVSIDVDSVTQQVLDNGGNALDCRIDTDEATIYTAE